MKGNRLEEDAGVGTIRENCEGVQKELLFRVSSKKLGKIRLSEGNDLQEQLSRKSRGLKE